MQFGLNDVIRWFQLNYIEIIAVTTGLLYIYFTIKEKTLLWLFGIVSSGLYVILLYRMHVYAYAVLYIYYVLIGFYGWYKWYKSAAASEHAFSIRFTPKRRLVFLLLFTAILVLPLYLVLKNYTDSEMALMDAVLTSGGMVATWMLTQKYLEQWLFWIIIDLVTCGLMIYQRLYPSAFLFLIYTLLAWKGYSEWLKEIKKNEA